ncbi:MAG: DNA methyltransferase [Pirellulaceae bacterium]
MPIPPRRLIETDEFPFEFLSRLAERESWRKEVHRPIYHVHKWWAKRLGSVFRGVLLGSSLPDRADMQAEYYRNHNFAPQVVFDPFMGSGTTVGEAHKLGMTALGRDINPVAVEAVSTALGPMDRKSLLNAFEGLSATVGHRIRELYKSIDSQGRPCDVLYYFWVMQARCPDCQSQVDLFPSYIVARNAYPARKPEIQIACPQCWEIFPGLSGQEQVTCRACQYTFDANSGPAIGTKAKCTRCSNLFAILDTIRKQRTRPTYRLYGKLVLTRTNNKEYLAATEDDHKAYQSCTRLLKECLDERSIALPDLALEHGYNTRQALSYGFANWRDFFNDRHLLALGWLHAAISEISDGSARGALLTLFSGVLEFNNLFASYKGEGTGAVRHMFSHHILKPERVPIEAHPWGTPKSSGSFLNLFRTRLLRAIDYRESPTEIYGERGPSRVCSEPFLGNATSRWPPSRTIEPRQIHLSCGNSAASGLADRSVDLVVTDPPFFDNVHYSELADFFFAWQRLRSGNGSSEFTSTRQVAEVQDADVVRFAAKLQAVFLECHRVLKDDGLLVFSYHHSRDEGWRSLAEAILGSGFHVVNSHPVKAEMSIATPKSQAKEPIQLDMILICRKQGASPPHPANSPRQAIERASAKLARLAEAGFALSRNDRRIVIIGQLLTAISDPSDIASSVADVSEEVDRPCVARPRRVLRSRQNVLFGETE